MSSKKTTDSRTATPRPSGSGSMRIVKHIPIVGVGGLGGGNEAGELAGEAPGEGEGERAGMGLVAAPTADGLRQSILLGGGGSVGFTLPPNAGADGASHSRYFRLKVKDQAPQTPQSSLERKGIAKNRGDASAAIGTGGGQAQLHSKNTRIDNTDPAPQPPLSPRATAANSNHIVSALTRGLASSSSSTSATSSNPQPVDHSNSSSQTPTPLFSKHRIASTPQNISDQTTASSTQRTFVGAPRAHSANAFAFNAAFTDKDESVSTALLAEKLSILSTTPSLAASSRPVPVAAATTKNAGSSSSSPFISDDQLLSNSTPAMLIPGSTADKVSISFKNHTFDSNPSSGSVSAHGSIMTTDAQSTSSGLKFAVGGAGVAIPASAAHTSVTSATPAAFSLGVVQDQSLGLPSSRIYSITNGPTQNNSSIISSSQAGKVYPTQQQQQRPISFDPSVFNRRHSQSQQIPRHHDVLTNNNLPLASLEPSSLSSSFTGELMQQMRNYDDEDSTSDSSDSSDSDNDEGQVFRTSVSIQVPASQSAGTMSSTAKTANKSKPRRPSSSPQRRRESTPTPPKDPSSIPSAAASPRSNVGPNTAPTSHTPASSSTAATTPLDPDAIRSPTTRTLKRDSVGIARKPSYQSLSRSSVGGSPYAASGAGSGSVPLGGSVGVAARNPARNVSFGDVASFLRQQTANSAGGSVVSSSSFVADSSRGSVAAAAAAAAAAAGGFAGSWKLGSSFGSFKRNLSGVSIKRKDSIVSTHSIGGFSNQSGSFVAPSPAMSYLSMLAENLAEPPRGVYYEGDQIGDWVLGKEIGHGSFSRVFQASPAAESELTEHLSLSTKVAIKIVAKALPAPSTTTPMQSAHGSEVSLVGSTGTTSQRSSISGRDECGAGADDVRRLLDHEIAVWSGLDHPNILGMVQMMDVDDAVFIVSELAEGGTLLDYLGKRGRVKENVAKRMFKQVAEAVRYLHCIAMVVHRDIKCENILIMEAAPPESSSSALSTSSSASSLNSPYWGSAWGGGSNSQQEAPAPTPISQPADWIPTVKLADFGLSERLTNSATSVDPLPTTTGSLVNSDPIFCIGSLHYCAPEELKTTIVASPAGDMWSLGCVFYTMLTASLPFNDEFLPRLQQSIMTGRYDEAKLARAGVSDAGRSMIQGLLNVNPETRLTIQEVCEHEYFSHC